MEIEIGEIILEEEVEINEIELDVEKVYPELEDLEVTPSSIEQNFNHPNSYGYDKVKVKAVEGDTLNVTPTTQNQQYTGLYGTVNVSAVDNTIDNNIQPENIKENVNVLGVTGTLEPKPIELKRKDVNFYDYNGSIIYSYNKNEFLALEELPELPKHKYLTSNGWNWTKEEMNDFVNKHDAIDVGATYNTTNNTTYLFFGFPSGVSKNLTIWVKMDGNTSATVDWGDGTTSVLENTSSSETDISITKSDYAIPSQDTEIIVKIIGGSFKIGKSGNYNLFGNARDSYNYNHILKKIYIGSNCYGTNGSSFAYCIWLESIVFPSTFTISSNGFIFNFTKNLKLLIFPRNLTLGAGYGLNDSKITMVIYSGNSASFGTQDILANARNLLYVTPPLKAISTPRLYYNTYYFTKAVFPKSIRTFHGQTVLNAWSLTEIDLTEYDNPLSLPTLSGANWSFSSNCKFLVKNQEMYNAFTTATNWSTYAEYFQVKGA